MVTTTGVWYLSSFELVTIATHFYLHNNTVRQMVVNTSLAFDTMPVKRVYDRNCNHQKEW